MAHYDWDIKPLTYMVDAKKERAFKRAGAFIRADARQSIRVSIRNSKPGEPPKAKSRKMKNTIVFAADKDSVVTGSVRYAPADSTPHILEGSGWRQDTIGRIKARWERANPQEARRLRKEQKAQARAAKKNKPKAPPVKRERSQAELDHIREYYQKKNVGAQMTADSLTSAQSKKLVRFFIARRPYIQPAFEKNKQKVLALMQ